jgi:hypothetical protein
MKRWQISVAILGCIIAIGGCASTGHDAPEASVGPSPAQTKDVECLLAGGIWHTELNYCEYRSPASSVPLDR